MIDYLWYRKNIWSYFLWPFSQLFRGITALRRIMYKKGFSKSYKSKIPVVVVGNISVGGNGKTPLVIYLVEEFRRRGFKPGVVSRGYGGKSPYYPFDVSKASSPKECGDEPYLIHSRTNCPVVVDPIRENAVKKLESEDVDIIISDDGLQHYKMGRDVELIVMDATRMLGNEGLLPMGPLREGKWRLKTVDAIIVNGKNENPNYVSMSVEFDQERLVKNFELAKLNTDEIVALSGIGNPKRFYQQLVNSGFKLIKTISFKDHAQLTKEMINEKLGNWIGPVVMTEKDAVKCKSFAQDNWFYIPISAKLDQDLIGKFEKKLH